MTNDLGFENLMFSSDYAALTLETFGVHACAIICSCTHIEYTIVIVMSMPESFNVVKARTLIEISTLVSSS